MSPHSARTRGQLALPPRAAQRAGCWESLGETGRARAVPGACPQGPALPPPHPQFLQLLNRDTNSLHITGPRQLNVWCLGCAEVLPACPLFQFRQK